MIQKALFMGIKADYVRMDTWFTTKPMIKEISATGLDVIGMVKQLKQKYTYQSKEFMN